MKQTMITQRNLQPVTYWIYILDHKSRKHAQENIWLTQNDTLKGRAVDSIIFVETPLRLEPGNIQNISRKSL